MRVDPDQGVAVPPLGDQRQLERQRPLRGGLGHHPPSLGECAWNELDEFGCKAVGESIGRVAEDELERTLVGTAQEASGVPANDLRSIRQSKRFDVPPRGGWTRVDEGRLRRTARERLDRERARTAEEIEHTGV